MKMNQKSNKCVLGIKGVPKDWSMKTLYQRINKGGIKNQFQVLNFSKPSKQQHTKLAFIRVSQDAMLAVHHFSRLRTTPKLHAFISTHLPGENPRVKQNKKKANNNKQPNQPTGNTSNPVIRLDRHAKITAEWILHHTHLELLEEIQRKFRAVPDLNKKTNDKLLDELAMGLFRRLKTIMEAWKDPSGDPFNVTRVYRNEHPHSTDYEWIMSTLHKIEDAEGTPRTEISEKDLITNHKAPHEKGSDTYEEEKRVSGIIENRIVAKLNRYVSRLQTEPSDADTPEDKARKRIWTEFKKMEPTFSSLVKVVIANNFPAPVDQDKQRNPTQMMRVYGEPFLPDRETLSSLLQEYGALSVSRSKVLFNLLRFNVPLKRYPAVMALDGKVAGGAKLVVRPSTWLSYKVKPMLVARVLSAFKQTKPEAKPETKPEPEPEPEPETKMEGDDEYEDWGPYAGF